MKKTTVTLLSRLITARGLHLYKPIPLHSPILLWFIIKVGSIYPGSNQLGYFICTGSYLYYTIPYYYGS
jgi:hypothetical protein